MSAHAQILEDFDAGVSSLSMTVKPVDDAALDAAQTKGFESGYQSGWDDALASQDASQDLIREDFARSLRDLGFTYYEARTHVQKQAIELFEALLERILPRLSADILRENIKQHFETVLDAAISVPVIIRANPENSETLQGLATDQSFAVRFDSDPSLDDGQAFLKLGDHEVHFDLNALFEALKRAMDALSEANTGESAVG